MKAIVPLNVAALRVNATDSSNLVNDFKGATAAFDALPYVYDQEAATQKASAGDKVARPLEQQTSAGANLQPGIHLHWELPDFFRRGVQDGTVGADIVFPATPNRFLVIRHLSRFDSGTQQYGPVHNKCWIVESDYVALEHLSDKEGVLRPAVAVPITPLPTDKSQPYLYMGRVLDYGEWNPVAEQADFLPSRTGIDGKPSYLTSVGFVGPAFSSFYPDCSGVFGFWDHFGDAPEVRDCIVGSKPIKFKASYQVVGWVNEPDKDPLAGIADAVRRQFADYIDQCDTENVEPDPKRTPAAIFADMAMRKFQWVFDSDRIAFTLDDDKQLASLDVPDRTICAGIIQEIVWDLPQGDTAKFFLANSDPGGQAAVWTAPADIAVGNTVVEALSALMKFDAHDLNTEKDVLHNYEFLLDALQLGLLYGLEKQSNKIITLEEELHSKAFGRVSGGSLWIVRQRPKDSDTDAGANAEVTLPLDIAERLHLLNGAQKDYDQARAALDLMRKQLFMDWTSYMQQYVEGAPPATPDVGSFIDDELNAVLGAGQQTGLLLYQQDDTTREITGLAQATPPDSLAGTVGKRKQELEQALQDWWAGTQKSKANPDSLPYKVHPVPAPPFWMPTDPVLLMEGERLEPVRRNGPTGSIRVRITGELLTQLTVQAGGSSFTVDAAGLSGRPAIEAATPMQADIQAVVDEASLLVPGLAGVVADALAAKSGTNNPAAADRGGFIASLQAAQGGVSPLDGSQGSGLYQAVRDGNGTVALSRPAAPPLQVVFGFGNESGHPFPPDPVGWNAQRVLPGFPNDRIDPFMPVFLVWTVDLVPLRSGSGADYAPDDLTRAFSLDADGIDYRYQAGASFTRGTVSYGGSIVLSKRPTFSLARQIDLYKQNYGDDDTNPQLDLVKQVYAQRKIMSQMLSGFSLAQTLRHYFPRIEIADLVMSEQDAYTANLAQAAAQSRSTPDNWYDSGFNGQGPIRTGLQAEGNFGPVRAGFIDVTYLEIVDVFGQRMRLTTDGGEAIRSIAAISLQPAADDSANAGKIFLPPRLLVPTRLWFRWLSAAHNSNVAGVTDDFVEMSTHPATSPVFGWVVPNHLDNSLFVYDADGAPIGSFGLEHGAAKYRTRAGNANNAGDALEPDLGNVNPHVAEFMRYLHAGQDGDENARKRSAAFLADLMQAILDSEPFIAPANYAQDAALAVFIGRPLALTRAVVALETAGNRLPLNQEATRFWDDVSNSRTAYADREKTSSANLAAVSFPLRLGELANLDDGLVGYVVEQDAADRYGTKGRCATLYAPAAGQEGANGVTHPTAGAIELTLNAPARPLTMLVDPRAAVHATTGILPVEALQIPPDQYSGALRRLAVTFFTAPVLRRARAASTQPQPGATPADGLTLPLPQEPGLDWSWILPGSSLPGQPLKANAADETAAYGFTPQALLEGWLALQPAKSPTSSKD